MDVIWLAQEKKQNSFKSSKVNDTQVSMRKRHENDREMTPRWRRTHECVFEQKASEAVILASFEFAYTRRRRVSSRVS